MSTLPPNVNRDGEPGDVAEGLTPEVEAALRQRATWPEPAPSPTMLERAMAQHDAEMQASRRAKQWWRHAGSSGLLAAAVALAAIGLTFGTVTSPRPAGQMVFDGAGSISLRARAGGGVETLEISGTSVSAAGDERAKGAAATEGAAPAIAAVPPAEPSAPSAPSAPASGQTGRGAGLVGGAFGTGGAPATTASTTVTTTGAAADAANSGASQTNVNTNLIGEAQVDSSQVPGGPISQAAVAPYGGPSEGASRPMVRSEPRRVPPTSRDWALYVTRIVLVGGPWLLMGVALVAIAVIRARNAR